MLCVGVTGALAEAITGMEITAVIKAEGATNQALTGDGEFSVDFSKQFTLEIKVKSQLNLPGKKLEITVPEGLTVVEYPVPNPKQGDMAESVEFVKSTKSYGAYQPNNGTDHLFPQGHGDGKQLQHHSGAGSDLVEQKG